MVRWLSSPLISTVHGFSTRYGGVSPAPYNSLNFGGHEDAPANIAENRRIGLTALGVQAEQIAYLKQIHSNTVCIAAPGIQTGDALVTREKQLPMAVSAADCYPILFHDPVNEVIGAAHAGWKGTLARIAANTIAAMAQLGADPAHIHIAIGPGISRKNYEVSADVIDQFAAAGFPGSCWSGRYLDLLAANRFVLEESGIIPEHIWALNRCTTEPDFFSYRRDQGKTGRMWAVISL